MLIFSTRITGVIALVAGFATAGLAQAASVSVNVNGSSNPFLSGHPAGTVCCGGDATPGQGSALVPALLTAGDALHFSGIGGFNYAGGGPSSSLDGQNDGTSLTYIYDMTADYGTGLSGPLHVNVDGLVGVFLTDAIPSGPAPAQLDFAALGLDAATYSPGVGQIFWIGDGLTGLGNGSVQSFIVPVGATRLFLGSVDGSGWSNNYGLAKVTIDGVTSLTGSVPEASTWAMMMLGFAGLGLASYRRTKRGARAAV